MLFYVLFTGCYCVKGEPLCYEQLKDSPQLLLDRFFKAMTFGSQSGRRGSWRKGGETSFTVEFFGFFSGRKTRQCGRRRINREGYEFPRRSCCVRMPVGIMGTLRGKDSAPSAGGNEPERTEPPDMTSGTTQWRHGTRTSRKVGFISQSDRVSEPTNLSVWRETKISEKKINTWLMNCKALKWQSISKCFEHTKASRASQWKETWSSFRLYRGWSFTERGTVREREK